MMKAKNLPRTMKTRVPIKIGNNVYPAGTEVTATGVHGPRVTVQFDGHAVTLRLATEVHDPVKVEVLPIKD